jgi:hypothetical protein
MSQKYHRRLPALVRYLGFNLGGTVVGSAARKLQESTDEKWVNLRDWDVIVPPGNWAAAVQLVLTSVPTDKISFNSFGGLKVALPHEGLPTELDVWPGLLDDHLRVAKVGEVFYQPLNNRFLTLS